MNKNQPGMILRLQAKPGMGDELFKVCTELHFTGDPDGPVDWVLSRSDDDPDLMWAFEFYRDDASFQRHYADRSLDEGHARVRELVVGVEDGRSMRTAVHIVSSS